MSAAMFTSRSTISQTRRAFLRDGGLHILGAGLALAASPAARAAEPKRLARLGLITDLHYADKPPAGSRYYRETPAKLAEAAAQFAKDAPEIVVGLGDLIDAAGSVEQELGYLRRINKDFVALPGRKYYLLGNHCVDTLTKEEFLGEVGQAQSHYAFEAGGVKCIALDACFRADGTPYQRKNFKWTDANLPAAQLEWLAGELKSAPGRVIVFAHQRLDDPGDHGVRNAPAVRALLEASGKVQAVFQGHSHKNDLKEINGIPYCTLVAMIEGSGQENNGYSTLDVLDDGSLQLTGFRQQKSRAWGVAANT